MLLITAWLAATASTEWAVVTGASTGIGKELALEAAKRGYNVVLAARREPLLREVAAEIEREHSVRTAVVACDLDSEAGVHKLHAAAKLSTIEALHRHDALLKTESAFLQAWRDAQLTPAPMRPAWHGEPSRQKDTDGQQTHFPSETLVARDPYYEMGKTSLGIFMTACRLRERVFRVVALTSSSCSYV